VTHASRLVLLGQRNLEGYDEKRGVHTRILVQKILGKCSLGQLRIFRPAILISIIRYFHRSLKEHTGILPYNRPLPLPSRFFPIR
jgi:hypothetical protein